MGRADDNARRLTVCGNTHWWVGTVFRVASAEFLPDQFLCSNQQQ